MEDLLPLLTRIAEALERLVPPPAKPIVLPNGTAWRWDGMEGRLISVTKISHIQLAQLIGIDRQRDILLRNTRQFANGKSANNALLWGAKGTGKSSLVKAVFVEMNGVTLIEVARDEIATLPRLLDILRTSNRRFLIFCDDLSFEADDTAYKALKSILDGGIEGRPDNVLLYATSNRRHLMAREMIENEQSTAINPAEAVDEKVSLSDRFGLWLGFHNMDQATYFEIVEGYAKDFGIGLPREELHARANEWAITRGGRSGRVAWQFIQQIAGDSQG